jgi:tetratricopeptide (TPR) repeat protein
MRVIEQGEMIESSPAPDARVAGRPLLGSPLKAVILIVSAGTVVYLDSFRGAFLFDDTFWIVSNSSIRRLWPPWSALFAPLNVSRPLIGLSNAMNYAISGQNTWSYHGLNLLIHILAGLALFGVVRRTLWTESLAQRFGKSATALAMAVALIWLVHPLQTQSVTYIVQRCESMMGMFYLVALYCSIRSFDSSRRSWWYAGAIAACAGGMLSKQVMVTAPVMVLLWDFLFAAGSIKKALVRRWPLYAGLTATWGMLAATVVAAPVNLTAGFAVDTVSPLAYLKSEMPVMVYYLRLSIWPSPLCLDYYGWPKAGALAEVAPYAVTIVTLGAMTAWAIYRRKPFGFIGGWFFLTISVTSTIMPFSDLVFEHRMYLSLAAITALVVFAAHGLASRFRYLIQVKAGASQRVGVAALTILVALLGIATARRNIDYTSELVMWRDVVAKRPNNARAHCNLGKALAERGDAEDSLVQFHEALRCDPQFYEAHFNLGTELFRRGALDEAKTYLAEAVRLQPDNPNAHLYLGELFGVQGHTEEAIQEFTTAVKIRPDFVRAYQQLGVALENAGRVSEAKDEYRIALRLRPDWQELQEHVAGLR